MVIKFALQDTEIFVEDTEGDDGHAGPEEDSVR